MDGMDFVERKAIESVSIEWDVAGRGDFDGDGQDGFAYYKGGTWYVDNNHDGNTDYRVNFEHVGTPFVGDFDGDGKDGFAFFVSGEDESIVVVNNQRLEGTIYEVADQYFYLDIVKNEDDSILVGDFDDDGIDEVVLYSLSNKYVELGSGPAMED